ncbi:MAG TPA: glycosyltransferase [Mobilitalea sp.]|nr:glycosyltransferase [Mobilitalea sp.]
MENKTNNENNVIRSNQSDRRHYSVDVIIPVYRPDEKLDRLLTMLYRQNIRPDHVFLLHTIENSEDKLKLPEIPESNIILLPINKKDFDHGGTRRYGASRSEADIMLFMTQDAVPVDELLIEQLIEPYDNPQVAATYGRQLPGEDSDILERYTRSFNYPNTSQLKSSEDIEELGIKTFFCSNVCATYRNDIYKKLGGFVERTIFNEDMIMAFTVIGAGYQIAYSAEAKVIHSHRYSYLQQLTRNFDLGVSHRQYSEFFSSVKSESEGIRLVKKSMKYLVEQKEYLMLPDLILNSGFKYLGYLLGSHYDILPKSLVIRCSMNKAYWR